MRKNCTWTQNKLPNTFVQYLMKGIKHKNRPVENKKVIFVKKFILNILYYKFIEKSRIFFFRKHVFLTFCEAENRRKCKIDPTVPRSIGLSFPSSSQLSNFIFFSTLEQFLFWNSVWFGAIRYAPQELPRTGEAVLCNFIVVFRIFL